MVQQERKGTTAVRFASFSRTMKTVLPGTDAALMHRANLTHALSSPQTRAPFSDPEESSLRSARPCRGVTDEHRIHNEIYIRTKLKRFAGERLYGLSYRLPPQNDACEEKESKYH